jgi:hypothetical protein
LQIDQTNRVTSATRCCCDKFEAERFEPKINLRIHQAAGMNREEFHLFDATVDLFDSSEINSASRNSDVKPLVLRVILVVRVYFPREPPSVAAGLVWRQRRRFHLSPGASPPGLDYAKQAPKARFKTLSRQLARCFELVSEMTRAFSAGIFLSYQSWGVAPGSK